MRENDVKRDVKQRLECIGVFASSLPTLRLQLKKVCEPKHARPKIGLVIRSPHQNGCHALSIPARGITTQLFNVH